LRKDLHVSIFGAPLMRTIAAAIAKRSSSAERIVSLVVEVFKHDSVLQRDVAWWPSA
jgi:hypothetical protein